MDWQFATEQGVDVAHERPRHGEPLGATVKAAAGALNPPRRSASRRSPFVGASLSLPPPGWVSCPTSLAQSTTFFFVDRRSDFNGFHVLPTIADRLF